VLRINGQIYGEQCYQNSSNHTIQHPRIRNLKRKQETSYVKACSLFEVVIPKRPKYRKIGLKWCLDVGDARWVV